MKPSPQKTLLIRMSSFGDLILALRALDEAPPGECHWLVAEELSEVVSLHPRVKRIWTFQRSGRRGALKRWVGLCRELWEQEFSEVVDLHQSLRSRVLRGLFWVWGIQSGRRIRVRSIQKERVRFWGRVFFRKLWPQGLWPKPWIERYEKVWGSEKTQEDKRDVEQSLPLQFSRQKREVPFDLALIPSSKHRSKEWSVTQWELFLKGLPSGWNIVLLGRVQDPAGQVVARLLETNSHLKWEDGRAWPTLERTANALLHSKKILSVDTGLGHLAEALGRSVIWLMGPTDASLGFAPNRAGSRVVEGKELWCRPCGKDGRHCIRFYQPYECWKRLKPEDVLRVITEV